MNKEIKIYGTIGSYNCTGTDIVEQINDAVNKGAKSITFRIHSEGGSVLDGNLIFNVIKQLSIPTKAIIEGMAASMASIIILAVDEVEICDNAFIMVHRPITTDSGNYDELTQSAKLLKDIEQNFLKCYSKKTKIDEQQIQKDWFDGKDHWLNADESVEKGLANRKILAVVKDVDIDTSSKNVKSIYNRFAAKLNIVSQKQEINMKEELIKRFNLQGVNTDSTDMEVLEKLDEAFKTLKEAKEKEESKAVEAIVDSAIKEGKILASTKNTYMSVGKTSGIGSLQAVLADVRKPVILANLVQSSTKHTFESMTENQNDVSKWGLDEYRKYNPKALKDNPELYKQLYEKEYGNK